MSHLRSTLRLSEAGKVLFENLPPDASTKAPRVHVSFPALSNWPVKPMVKTSHVLGSGWFVHERRYFANPTAAFGASRSGTYWAAKESLLACGVRRSKLANSGRSKG